MVQVSTSWPRRRTRTGRSPLTLSTEPSHTPPAPESYQQPPAAPAATYGQAPYTGHPQQVLVPKTNVLAIVSLISAFFVSLVAIITGHIALKQIKESGESGRGLAIAGLILGYAGIVAGALAIIIFVAAAATYSQ